jgi:hypothetical protein
MFKRLFFLFGVLSLVGLVACQSPTPEATPSSPESLATVVVAATPEPTATPVPEVTPSPTLESAGEEPSPTLVEVGARPSPTPTIPWQIPEVQPDDWVKGGDDAGLVLVEYSDFQ